ncbi:MAG TPA: arylesterase [Thermoanaerobaculia bacterium]
MNRRAVKIGAAGAVAIALLVVLWPSGVGDVRNLDSRGSSVIAFGDSLTEGYGASQGEAWPARLASKSGVEIVNAGVSGDTTETALARIETDVLARDPRIVIVGLGGNDFLRRVPVAATEANLRAIVRKIQASGAMVVLLGFEFPSIGPSYAKMYERIAEEEECLLVEDVLDGILRDTKLKSDEIHPNAAGYQIMADRIEEPLGKLIAKANRSRT